VKTGKAKAKRKLNRLPWPRKKKKSTDTIEETGPVAEAEEPGSIEPKPEADSEEETKA
jgi:hypothetical protein